MNIKTLIAKLLPSVRVVEAVLDIAVPALEAAQRRHAGKAEVTFAKADSHRDAAAAVAAKLHEQADAKEAKAVTLLETADKALVLAERLKALRS